MHPDMFVLSRVATRVFNVRLLFVFAFSKKWQWFEPTEVASLKTQQHAVNECGNEPLSTIVAFFEKLKNLFYFT